MYSPLLLMDMNTNWSLSSLLALCLLCVPSSSHASCDTVVIRSKHERRVERYQHAWSNLIPHYSKVQYAGGMGLVSLGIGWDYGRNQQWETDMMLGLIPRYSSDNAKLTFTLRECFTPWRFPLSASVHAYPFSCGIYMNTVFNNEFWTTEPDRYPSGYYGFSTRVRTHLFVGQRIKFLIPDRKRVFSNSITCYYELSTCDFYLISAVTNHLRPRDYLRLSFGHKLAVF